MKRPPSGQFLKPDVTCLSPSTEYAPRRHQGYSAGGRPGPRGLARARWEVEHYLGRRRCGEDVKPSRKAGLNSDLTRNDDEENAGHVSNRESIG